MESFTVSRQNCMGDMLKEKKLKAAMVWWKEWGTRFVRGTADGGSSQFWRQSDDGQGLRESNMLLLIISFGCRKVSLAQNKRSKLFLESLDPAMER